LPHVVRLDRGLQTPSFDSEVGTASYVIAPQESDSRGTGMPVASLEQVWGEIQPGRMDFDRIFRMIAGAMRLFGLAYQRSGRGDLSFVRW
jgi:hypothetical protein